MPAKHPDLRLTAEFNTAVADINREFLALLIHPELRDTDALGLSAAVLAGLRQLTPAELDEVASLPLLLPEFHPLPVCTGVRDVEWQTDERLSGSVWRDSKRDFANRLLTCLWQLARQDVWRTALYAGINRAHCRALGELSFGELSRCAASAAAQLRVRLAAHPCYWPDLLSLVRNGDDRQQLASRLAVIPLSIAQRWQSLPALREPAGP